MGKTQIRIDIVNKSTGETVDSELCKTDRDLLMFTGMYNTKFYDIVGR